MRILCVDAVHAVMACTVLRIVKNKNIIFVQKHYVSF